MESNETVVYRNDLNLVPLKKFRSVEMDIFFAVCSKMKDKGNQDIRLSFDNLKKISGQSDKSYRRFIQDTDLMYQKLLTLTYRTKEKGLTEYFVLFTKFSIDENKQEVSIRVNPDLEYILNDLQIEFTKYELKEFTTLSSRYTKTLYRLLKQYRDTGFYVVNMDSFRQLLDIPDSYRMTDIDRQVLNPAMEELNNIFKNIRVEKIKKGRSVVRLRFLFDKQDKIIQEDLPKVPMYNWLKGSN